MARNIVNNIEKRLLKDGIVECHYYTPDGTPRYVVGGVINNRLFDSSTLLIDHTAVLDSYNIRRGKFNVNINVYNPILGTYDFPMLFVKEISSDRRELKLEHVIVDDPENHDTMLQEFVDNLTIDMEPVLNFGQDQLVKIINQVVINDELIIRLLEPLAPNIEEGQSAWIVNETADSFNDIITINSEDDNSNSYTELLGPNFDIETSYGTITETDFESWNSLLNANTATSQDIIDKMFSGSLSGVKLGVDYSGLNNFIHFSSAKERVSNFKYKLELIEYYDNRVSILNNASGSDVSALQNNVTINTDKKNDVIGSFDGFERWLYSESTSSLFTHQTMYESEEYEIEGGRIGSQLYRISSWPKYISNGKYVLHPTTSPLATTWYADVYATASLYDSENNNSLQKTIPEHIQRDENNSQYELFVNMIGHHYDIIYSYINNLSKIYKPEEHPELGQNKHVLYQVAKSLGWNLSDGNQATALWQYKLGVSSGSGQFANTGSLFSKSDEIITTDIWRRIVNNLPYILKTKGTTRSLKALLNIYGIPQTLLSIREYGGPKVADDVPAIIEDRFVYALHFDSDAHLEIPNNWVSSSIGTWGIDRGEIPILTHEIRFRPDKKQNMALMSNRINDSIQSWAIALQYTSSYSGSDKYGRLHFVIPTGDGEASASMTNYFPVYDGNLWNLSVGINTYNTSSNTDTTYTVRCQQASDYITNKIVHSASINLTPSVDTHQMWASASDGTNSHILRLGGEINGIDTYAVKATLSASFGAPINSASIYNGTPITNNDRYSNIFPGTFTGSMQEYRSWLEVVNDVSFDLHTFNPTSYVSSISPTSSFDTLIRHYPFGTDLKTFDCSGAPSNYRFTSSHPNQSILDFSPPFTDQNNTYASASGFQTPVSEIRGNFVPVNETYYIQGVSIGGSLPRSQKIRLEDNKLINNLSPVQNAERSRFDRAPIDTNRIGLFYSMADQINKDIFNQIGDVDVDNFIGNPEDQFKIEYPDLDSFSKEYWKKYTDRNDINAFIRIFSQFDFAVFDQIKQLLPERADEAMGLLIEPHAIERAKVRLIRQPEFTNPQYDALIPEQIPSSSAESINYEASISFDESIISGISIYQTASNGYVDSNYLINVQISQTGSHTGSVNEGFVLNSRTSDIYTTETFFYSSPESASVGQYVSRSSVAGTYRDDIFIMTENQKYAGSKISAPGINQASIYPQLNFKPIIEVYSVNPNQLIYNETPSPDGAGTLLVE